MSTFSFEGIGPLTRSSLGRRWVCWSVVGLAILAPQSATADLIGDEITGCQSSLTSCLQFGGPGRFDQATAVVVDPGVEFIASFAAIPGDPFATAEVDFAANSFSIVWEAIRPNSNVGQAMVFGDLDWTNDPGIISDVILEPGATLPIDNLTFSDDTIQIEFGNFSFAAAGETRTAEFTIVFVPEPSTVVLLAVGVGSLIGTLRRRGHRTR